jgi:dihydroorotate dehydrogenase electron transfer subunit
MQPGTILENSNLKGGYYRIRFFHPDIARNAVGGQFVHVKINNLEAHLLRRPFSIHNTDKENNSVTVVYKVVGEGTKAMSELNIGDVCDLLGPLGVGYTQIADDTIPVFVAGGYGSAAMFITAKNAKQKGILMLGARSEAEVILDDVYAEIGCDVRIATNDGSVGKKGFVTELLDDVLNDYAGKKLIFCACGPHPMLIALSRILQERGLAGEISLDSWMCCGVGSCFGCVVKVNADNEQHWRYARSCKDGPVFNVNDIYVGE